MPLSDYQDEVSRMLRLLNVAREEIDDTMSVQQLQVFIACMCKPDGMPQADIQKLCRLTKSSTTTNIANLTDVTMRKRPGPGLVEQFVDPMNRVARVVRLSSKGEKAALRILGKVYKGGTKDDPKKR